MYTDNRMKNVLSLRLLLVAELQQKNKTIYSVTINNTMQGKWKKKSLSLRSRI